MATQTIPIGTEMHDVFPINGTDYIEFYVGNAKQAAHYYQSVFGFQMTAYRGPETGVRDRVSYLLVQNKIRLVLTSPLRRAATPKRLGPSVWHGATSAHRLLPSPRASIRQRGGSRPEAAASL